MSEVKLRIFPPITTEDKCKSLVTLETFLNVKSFDTSGRALMLYCFYALKAFDRDEGQPYCTDEWTAEQLTWNFKTVMETRKKLMAANLIRIVHKGRKRYVQVQYLPFRVSGRKQRSLGKENIPLSAMATPAVFDYYARWYDTIQSNPTSFLNTVHKKVGKAPKEKILHYLRTVYNKMYRNGYGIDRVDNELSFFFYLAAGVTNEFKASAKHMNNI